MPEGQKVSPQSGKEKTNKHKYFRRDGVRDKQEPSLGQMGPLPRTKWDPSLGQTGLSLFNSTVKSPFCPVCPWDGWGFVPGTIVPQGPSEKCLCVLCLLVFCSQHQKVSPHHRGRRKPPLSGADVHDFECMTSMTRRVLEKLSPERNCIDFLVPTIGDKIITYRFLFCGIIFGDYYRELYSIIFLGELTIIM